MYKYLIITLLLTSSCNRKTNQNAVIEPEAEITAKPKLEIFNDVDKVRGILYNVGIGELGSWRDDEMGGYMSITNYYPFGTNNLNNLAFYLLSDNPNNIQTLELVLNINNSERGDALKKLSEISQKTFEALNISFPNELGTAIKEGKPIKIDKETYTTELKLEKSRVSTWIVIIETKR